METNNRVRTSWCINFGLVDNAWAIGPDSFPASSANKCDHHLSVRPICMPVSILDRPVPYVFALDDPYTIGVHSLKHMVIARTRNDSYRNDEPIRLKYGIAFAVKMTPLISNAIGTADNSARLGSPALAKFMSTIKARPRTLLVMCSSGWLERTVI